MSLIFFLSTKRTITGTLVVIHSDYAQLYSKVLLTTYSKVALDYLVNVLQISSGNVAQAARLAKRNRSEFYKLLNKHHLEPQMFREQSEY